MPPAAARRPPLPVLPVLAVADELAAALARGHAVLSAAPGSGKTTLVPLLLRDAAWLAGRRIVMLEPRRPAARMAARRMAALLGEPVGRTVGYQVRFEREVGPATRIEVVTEGLLLRRLQSDPMLEDVGLLIFDEFHERNLVGDLSLALALDAAGLRDDLRLLPMSATLDVGPLAELLGAARVAAGGREHPVEVAWAAQDAPLRDPVPDCLGLLARALDEGPGDVLVFLPGQREIRRLHEAAAGRWGDRVEVQTLYGELSPAEQDRVLRGGGARRRVVLATDIAETSLTIDGVAAVVDSGLARKPVFDPNTGLTRLQTRRISRASATQRAGRAGRLGPGRCYRAWTPARDARLDAFTPPEILTADLAGAVLELAAWGLSDPARLRWPDPPPAAHWQQGVDLLQRLGALDGRARITPLGQAMARVPAHPRLAHVLAAAGPGAAAPAADVAALLSERDPLRAGFATRQADIGLRLQALAALRRGRELPHDCDRVALQRVDRAAAQFRRLAGPGDRSDGAPVPTAAGLVALAFPDRVARCTSADGRRYLMRNGRAAVLGEDDPLRGSRWLAVAAADAGRREGTIWLAAPLTDREVEACFGDAIESRRELGWDAALGDVVARRVRRLDAIVLDSAAVPLRPDDPTTDVICERIRADGLSALFDDPVDLRRRVMLAARHEPAAGWPDFSDDGLQADPAAWLGPWLRPGEGVRQLKRLRLEEVLDAVLGRERRQRLDRLLPTHFATPAGTRRRIDYAADGGPVLAVPLQEMLGLARGPAVADGAVPLVLHLLSPAGRPLQVTSDLAAFWAGAYAEVRKEMRGRYPKHVWPDDPANAAATRFTKRRR